MKTIRNIFSYGLMVMFLIPATGIYYTRHSCLKSGEIQLALEGNYSCCIETAPINRDPMISEGSCCDSENSSPANTDSDCCIDESSLNCCINVGKYLKSEDEYTPPGHIEMPHIKVPLFSARYSNSLLPVIHNNIEENAHSPPFTSSAVEILHKHSVLII